MNYARMFTLLGLIVVVVAFAATWLTVQSGPLSAVPLPARLFDRGLGSEPCEKWVERRVSKLTFRIDQVCVDYGPVTLGPGDVDTVKERIAVVYASAAAVIILLGLAFGAARRSRPQAA